MHSNGIQCSLDIRGLSLRGFNNSRMFKSHYTKLSFRQIFNAMEVGVMQSWKQFNIADCTVTVKEALKGLK
jgi:hypothetical protein